MSIPMERARKRGRRLGDLCTGKAERAADFDAAGAATFIHAYLVQHGPTSGEQLTAKAIAHGFVPHDARAYGSVYSGLARKGLIRCLRAGLPRERGHGTSGGRLWEAVR
jgi:hypothetical protein